MICATGLERREMGETDFRPWGRFRAVANLRRQIARFIRLRSIHRSSDENDS